MAATKVKGPNVFQTKNLFVDARGEFITSDIRGLARGASEYYLCIMDTAILQVSRSRDFWNWSAPVTVLEGANFSGDRIMFSGITSELAYSTVTNNADWVHVNKGVTDLDISSDIISYNNNRNQRVSMTLANQS